MDVVYVVRPGERNEELRYSLRSLSNLPHEQVHIAGYIPSWVRGACSIPVPAHPSRYRSAENNLRAALLSDSVSDPFYLFNDDFYVMHPMASIPVLHRGPLAPLLESYARFRDGSYVNGMRHALAYLQSLHFTNPMSYEMHTPLEVDKAQMLDVLNRRDGIDCYHLRTIYGNLYGKGGRQSPDVKVYKSDKQGMADWEQMPLLSTSDIMFRHHRVGAWLRSKLTDPSPYEHRTRAHATVY